MPPARIRQSPLRRVNLVILYAAEWIVVLGAITLLLMALTYN